jgi:hypothetical protein
LRDVKEEVQHVYAGPVQPVFTGSMTLRIHEADRLNWARVDVLDLFLHVTQE